VILDSKNCINMAELTVHTSLLFDPKEKKNRQNVSITVDTASGLMVRILERDDESVPDMKDGDIDLRGKYVMPGLVDAHTHVFLHSYEYVNNWNSRDCEKVMANAGFRIN
jgi:imidazolonepropionase-like amidohydrolase